jgi:hypothetical protein
MIGPQAVIGSLEHPFLIDLCCYVDEMMADAPKHRQVKVYPSDVVTLASTTLRDFVSTALYLLRTIARLRGVFVNRKAIHTHFSG